MPTNPYKTPASNIETDQTNKRSIWWKIYFFFITLLSLLSFAGIFFMEGVGITEYVSVVIWLVATIGLFGFVFLKKIITPGFWLIFFIGYLTFSIAYYFITNIDLSAGISQTEFIISNLISWLLSLPAIVALYTYSKPSCRPWSGTNN
jgi:hypothetical protein